MELEINTILKDGKYRIEKVLGRGGFGITYLSEQNVTIKGDIGTIKTKIKVTIKEFFMKDLCNRDSDTSYVSVPSVGSKELVDRFKVKFIKEAQNIAIFDHDHIIKVLDVFEENGTAYYVMEYVDGGSLNEHVTQCGALSERESLHYIGQIADALRYIHRQKINHLDVKPSNILLKEGAISVLIDFGLAKQYDNTGEQTSSTPVGISKGYAPMEQYKAGGVSLFSPATDIYSLGATLYKLVTGKTPPEAHDIFDSGLPELPSELSENVKQAIIISMQPSRSARPQSIEAFLNILGIDADNDETQVPNSLKVNPTFKSKIEPKIEPKVEPRVETKAERRVKLSTRPPIPTNKQGEILDKKIEVEISDTSLWSNYIGLIKTGFKSEGKITRGEYWSFFWMNLLIGSSLANIIFFIIICFETHGLRVFNVIYILVTFIPSITAAVKRLHDSGESGELLFVPLYNIVLLARKGNVEKSSKVNVSTLVIMAFFAINSWLLSFILWACSYDWDDDIWY